MLHINNRLRSKFWVQQKYAIIADPIENINYQLGQANDVILSLLQVLWMFTTNLFQVFSQGFNHGVSDKNTKWKIYCTLFCIVFLTEGNSDPTVLQQAEVEIINQSLCRSAYGLITPRMMCAGLLSGKRDACRVSLKANTLKLKLTLQTLLYSM